MLIIDSRAAPGATATDEIHLPFETRCKSRLRARLASGLECDIILARGSVMRGGDRLQARDGRVVAVVAADEDLLEARTADALLLARAAYHLGNRHVALAIAPGVIRLGRDHVLGDMLRGLGLQVTAARGPFEPESGAYGGHGGAHGAGHGAGGHGAHEHAGGHAHPHGHSPDGEGRGPRIHDHFSG